MSMRRTVGGIGALLTCPCHAVPLLLLLGGTAGSAWLGRHLALLVVALGVVFLGSLWLLLSDKSQGVTACRTCGAADDATHAHTESGDVLRRS